MRFEDRREAGRLLAARLERYRDAGPIVLALPRGGVPVAFEISRALQARLDVLIVRKLGAPSQAELGIGAVIHTDVPTTVLNDALVRDLRVPECYLREEAERQFAEIARRDKVYRGGRPMTPLANQTVILVDDGIATGSTMLAAVRGIRASHARAVVVATPVAPPEVVEQLRLEVDDIVCLHTPEPFGAVGCFYGDFHQLTDEEVLDLLAPTTASTTARPDDPAVATPLAPWCLAVFSVVWAILAFNPLFRADWLLENIATIVCVGLAVVTYPRWRLSERAYVQATLFALLHTVGAHYTYSHVPLGDWLRDLLDLQRNDYDRIVHFSFGLLMLPAIRELAFRNQSPPGRVALVYLSLSAVMFWSVAYELVEWAVASTVDPQAGTAYLGTQGDEWDAQKDIAMAALGAALALLAEIVTADMLARRRMGQAVGATRYQHRADRPRPLPR